MLNATDSTNIYLRYPDGLLIKRFLPAVFELKLYASPVWFVVGLIGNLLSLFIWVSKRQRGKNSSAVYLATLALTDLLLIICLFSEYLRIYLFFSSLLSVNGICQLFQGSFLFLQYYSIVLTFGFTLERWIAICYPFKRRKLCSTSRALTGVSVLAIIVACFSVFFASTWEVVDEVCILAKRWQIDTIFPIYLSTAECIFSLIVPIATLVFNILVLREISHLANSKFFVGRGHLSTRHSLSILRRPLYNQKSHRQQEKGAEAADPSTNLLIFGAKHSSAQTSGKEQANFQAVTFMLVILSFYLIICTLPVGIVFVVQTRFTDLPHEIADEEVLPNPAWHQYLRFLTAKEIIDFLCSSHCACNFIIYVLTCKNFRQHLKDLLLFRHQKTRSRMILIDHSMTACCRGKSKQVDEVIPVKKNYSPNHQVLH